MTTLMIAVAAMTVGAAVGFLTARLVCGTAWAARAIGLLNSSLKIHGWGDW
jgi:hypothetical protein